MCQFCFQNKPFLLHQRFHTFVCLQQLTLGCRALVPEPYTTGCRAGNIQFALGAVAVAAAAVALAVAAAVAAAAAGGPEN